MTKKEIALNVYNELRLRFNAPVGRGSFITECAMKGIKQSTACTYFQKINSGAWT